jgi:hypothetical protein
MNKRRLSQGIALATVLSAAAVPSTSSALDLSLTAFGDVNYGILFGDPASRAARDSFEAFGEEVHVKSSHQGFGLVGTDFVLTAELPADIVYLGEINLQVARGTSTEFDLDVERMFLEKRFWQQFNLQAGLFFTPVGYFNRTLYSRAYLMNSVQIPDLFEEELGFVPTHTVGVQAHGEFQLGHEHRLGYALSFGNGRPPDPTQNVYARDDDGWRSATAMLEWFFPWANEGRFGVSGWYDRIKSHYVARRGDRRELTDPTLTKMELQEVGVDVHFLLKSRWVNVMLEGVYQVHTDMKKNLPSAYRNMALLGTIAEVSLNVGPNGAIKPYLRYDRVKMPKNGDPYLELRAGEEGVTRIYLNQTNQMMAGVAWDIVAAVRAKVEYSYAFTGAREQHGVVAQTAFAF